MSQFGEISSIALKESTISYMSQTDQFIQQGFISFKDSMAAGRLLAEFKFNPDLLALVSLSNQNCSYVKLLLSKYEKKLFKDVKDSRNVRETDETFDRAAHFDFDDENVAELENEPVVDQDNILETLI